MTNFALLFFVVGFISLVNKIRLFYAYEQPVFFSKVYKSLFPTVGFFYHRMLMDVFLKFLGAT